MGIPTPWPPPPSDDDCVLCTPELFLPGQTPRRVKMSIWGILDCPAASVPAPNGLFVLNQQDPLFCNWRLSTAEYDFYWLNGAGRTDCYVVGNADQGYFFYWAQPPICNTFMNNQYQNCTPPFALGYGGTVMIFWP